MRPNNDSQGRQRRRDITAGIIALSLGVLIIDYGTGGNVELTAWLTVISGAIGAIVWAYSQRR